MHEKNFKAVGINAQVTVQLPTTFSADGSRKGQLIVTRHSALNWKVHSLLTC